MNDLPSFPSDHEAFLDEAVKSGRYGSRAEVIEEALLLLKRRDASSARLSADLARAVADIDAGRTYDVHEAFDQVQDELRRRQEQDESEQLAEIRAAVARGFADVEAGRVMDAEDAFAQLETHFRALAHVRSR
ncbi:MAG TPA: type II toxin-antitoxin system ParD family antitoxin [Allosphingosinicella sp.]|jgi:antitoxin ParD1/3/4|nr:type II toxin-antitoxin system ParD family antitoxin [Allosphingosinicella sp.]